MEENDIVELFDRDEISDPLTDILCAGAGKLIMQAIEAEFSEFMVPLADLRTKVGKVVVVCNSYWG
ncbi:MAG: hypothetical protein HRT36_02890 [Alphaproteobacteria bacterium]|nr:hypothetical protein [Alphaproteobacteria bacterium]